MTTISFHFGVLTTCHTSSLKRAHRKAERPKAALKSIVEFGGFGHASRPSPAKKILHAKTKEINPGMKRTSSLRIYPGVDLPRLWNGTILKK